jgi:hypothetical protein
MAQARPSWVPGPCRGIPGADRRGCAQVVAMRGEHDLSTVVDLSGTISAAIVIAIDDADVVVDASEVTFLRCQHDRRPRPGPHLPGREIAFTSRPVAFGMCRPDLRHL